MRRSSRILPYCEKGEKGRDFLVTKKERGWLMVRVQERALAFGYKGRKQAGNLKGLRERMEGEREAGLMQERVRVDVGGDKQLNKDDVKKGGGNKGEIERKMGRSWKDALLFARSKVFRK